MLPRHDIITLTRMRIYSNLEHSILVLAKIVRYHDAVDTEAVIRGEVIRKIRNIID